MTTRAYTRTRNKHHAPMNSKAKSTGMRCLGGITVLAGQRIVYYVAPDGGLWRTFDGMELTNCASVAFGPKTEAEAVQYIREYP